MRIPIKLIILLLLIPFFLSDQITDKPGFEFLPGGLHYVPLKADYNAPRIGVLYYPDNGNLKVDLGNSIDLFAYTFDSFDEKITVGIDFYAYALSTSYSGKRLQIDALDGFFGGNMSYSALKGENRLLGRLRIIHNSAHLVDGHYDNDKGGWIDGKIPLPYARDFIELNLDHEINYASAKLKYSGGSSFSFLVRPDDLKRFSFNAGIEISSNKLVPKIFNNDCSLFVSYFIRLIGLPKYSAGHNILIGTKFGEWDTKGIVFYFSYFAGNNMFSEYYYQKIKKIGIGFYIDFI